MNADHRDTTETHVASWWGRRSADPTTIYCSQHGWREAVWKRNRRGRWVEVSATLRPVISLAYPCDGSSYTLGEPRKVT